jgi:hypothetical protein
LERENKRETRRRDRLARAYPNPIAKARRYEAALADEGASYRTVARQFRVTREEVCQYMALLRRLPNDVRSRVESEREPIRLRSFSLRRLLEIARLPSDAAKRSAFAAVTSGGDNHECRPSLERT